MNELIGILLIVSALPIGLMGWREWIGERQHHEARSIEPSHHLRIMRDSEPYDWQREGL